MFGAEKLFSCRPQGVRPQRMHCPFASQVRISAAGAIQVQMTPTSVKSVRCLSVSDLFIYRKTSYVS